MIDNIAATFSAAAFAAAIEVARFEAERTGHEVGGCIHPDGTVVWMDPAAATDSTTGRRQSYAEARAEADAGVVCYHTHPTEAGPSGADVVAINVRRREWIVTPTRVLLCEAVRDLALDEILRLDAEAWEAAAEEEEQGTPRYWGWLGIVEDVMPVRVTEIDPRRIVPGGRVGE